LRIGKIHSLIVIGQPDCGACKRAKDFFDLQRIPYVYHDLDDIPLSLSRELVRCRKENHVSALGVPLIIRDGELFMGFSEEEFLQGKPANRVEGEKIERSA